MTWRDRRPRGYWDDGEYFEGAQTATEIFECDPLAEATSLVDQFGNPIPRKVEKVKLGFCP